MQESASSVQADEEVMMAPPAESGNCLALVVQSPLAAAHAKADVSLKHHCLVCRKKRLRLLASIYREAKWYTRLPMCLVCTHAGDAE